MKYKELSAPKKRIALLITLCLWWAMAGEAEAAEPIKPHKEVSKGCKLILPDHVLKIHVSCKNAVKVSCTAFDGLWSDSNETCVINRHYRKLISDNV